MRELLELLEQGLEYQSLDLRSHVVAGCRGRSAGLGKGIAAHCQETPTTHWANDNAPSPAPQLAIARSVHYKSYCSAGEPVAVGVVSHGRAWRAPSPCSCGVGTSTATMVSSTWRPAPGSCCLVWGHFGGVNGPPQLAAVEGPLYMISTSGAT
jgi:hypothetical protein